MNENKYFKKREKVGFGLKDLGSSNPNVYQPGVPGQWAG